MKIPRGMPEWVFWRESFVCWNCEQEIHREQVAFYREVVDAPGALYHHCPDGSYTDVDPTTIPPDIEIVACRHRGCDAARPADEANDWHTTGRLFALNTGRIYGEGEFCPRHREKRGPGPPVTSGRKKARKAQRKKAEGRVSPFSARGGLTTGKFGTH